MIRFIDLLVSIFAIIFISPLALVLVMVLFLYNRHPFFVQERLGRGVQKFKIIKFRTMFLATENLPSHLVDKANVTKIGILLRKSKLDELPQIINVLKGEMSFVGPRPCLPSQVELINERMALGVFDSRPGITGLAQIQGIDMSTPALLAKTDAEMLSSLNGYNYFRYIFLTLLGKGAGDRVKTN